MKDKIVCSEINLVSLIIAMKRFDGMGNCFLHDVCPMEADGPLGKWELQIFFLDVPIDVDVDVLVWYTPPLPPVDFPEPSQVYCQLQWLFGLFLTLSLPMDISKDP